MDVRRPGRWHRRKPRTRSVGSSHGSLAGSMYLGSSIWRDRIKQCYTLVFGRVCERQRAASEGVEDHLVWRDRRDGLIDVGNVVDQAAELVRLGWRGRRDRRGR